MQKIGFCERYKLTTGVFERWKQNTRRLEKRLQKIVADYEATYNKPFCVCSQYYDTSFNCLVLRTPYEAIKLITHYKLNEIVAVAQAYNDFYNDECDPRQFPEGKGWTNKMFVKPSLMPHQIQITGINIERLQDISDEDCLREGIGYNKEVGFENGCYYFNDYEGFRTPRNAFATLINRISGKSTWEFNPWVVVYEFKLLK